MYSDEDINFKCPLCKNGPLHFSAKKCKYCYAEQSDMDAERDNMREQNESSIKARQQLVLAILLIFVLLLIFSPKYGCGKKYDNIKNNETEYFHEKVIMENTNNDNTNTSVDNEKNTNSPITKDSKNLEHYSNHDMGNIRKAEIEDISNYTTNSDEHFDIVVIVVDDEFKSVNKVSSQVAKVYRDNGNTVTNSYFTNSFLLSSYFADLESGSSKVINMLNLSSKIDHIVIGRYSVNFENASETTGLKYICITNLDIKVISCKKKVQVDGFPLTTPYPGDNKEIAENGAVSRLISQLKEHKLNYN